MNFWEKIIFKKEKIIKKLPLFYKCDTTNFKKKCSVCEKIITVDQFDQGKCSNCGWYNSIFDNQDKLVKKFPDIYLSKVNAQEEVIYPNLVSLNKAKRLFKDGKSLRPDLSDFIDALYFYSEMQFRYNGLDCSLFLEGDPRKIELAWSPENFYYFDDKEDFIKNAKIGNEYLRDIWDKVEDPDYM